MSKLNILVAEDEERWQNLLKETLKSLGHEVNVEIASDYAAALRLIKNPKYDLATVDLELTGAPPISIDTELLGMELMREWRTGSHNQGCGLIVVTAHPTLTRQMEALIRHGAFDFIEKQNFDNHYFSNRARAAILDARLKHAINRQEKRLQLTITFNEEYLIGCKMIGPDRRTEYVVRYPKRFDVADLIRRTDGLNLQVLNGGEGGWRLEANSVGDAIYTTLATEPRILQDLRLAKGLSEHAKDLWIEFSGPAKGLGIPFELLRDGNESLCLKNTLTRCLVQEGVISHKTDPFHTFIQRLQKNGKTLRLLIVGSNSDGRIPEAEEEARVLNIIIEEDLQTLGIPHEVTALIGKDATYNNVRDALRNGGYHVFHYAGHGRYKDDLPEISGLILLDSGKPRVLSAANLNLWVQDSDLQFVFLSCCLGARSAAQVGRGDFFGIIEALARADVPTVLGYRWTLADAPALILAKSFYESLWRTFSPAESLTEARSNAATGEAGLDDETWLSPVLLVQNR